MIHWKTGRGFLQRQLLLGWRRHAGACGNLVLVPGQVSKASRKPLLEEFDIIPYSLGTSILVFNSRLMYEVQDTGQNSLWWQSRGLLREAIDHLTVGQGARFLRDKAWATWEAELV